MIENDKLLRHVDSMFKQTSPLEILSPQNIRSLVQQTKTAINGSIANLSQINLSKLNLGGNNEPQWALASGTEINQQDNSDQRNKSLTISHLGIFGWGGEKKEYELGDDGIVREVQKSDPNNTINNSEPSPAENSNDNKDPQEYKDVGFWGRCYQDQNGNEISAQEYDELVKKHSARTSSRDASTANTDSNTVKKDSSRNPDEYKDVGFWGRCYQDKDGNEISVKEYEELVKKHSARTSSRDVSTANTDSGTDNIAQETIQIVNEINGGSFIEPERGLGACAKYSKDVVKALEKKGIQAETLFLPDRSHMVVVAKINGEDVLIDGTVGQFIRPDRRIAGTKWGVKKNVDDNPTTSDLAKQGYAVLKPGDLDRYKHFMDPKTDLVIEGTSEQKRNPVERRWESKTSSSSPSSTSTSSSKEYDPKSETYMEQVARHKKEREESDKSWRESQQNAYLNACAMAELYGREPPKKEDYEL